MNDASGWSAYEKLVLSEIEDLKVELHNIDEKVTLARIDIAQLKIKAGMWGAVAGLIPGIVVVMATLVAGGGG